MMENELLGPLGNATYRGYAKDIHKSARTILDVLNDVTEPARFGAFSGQDGDFRHLIELAPDLICMCRDGRIEMINPAGASMLGVWPVESLNNRLLTDFVHPDHARMVAPDLSDLCNEKLRVPISFVRPDKVSVDVEIAAVPYVDSARANTGAVMVIARDVTDRNRALMAVAQREENLRLVMDSVGDGIVAIEEDGTIEMANAAFGSMFGIGSETLIGRNIGTLIPAMSGGHLGKFLKGADDAESAFALDGSGELEGLRANATPFPVKVVLSTSMQGGRKRYIGAFRDVTIRKSFEDRLRILATRDPLTGLANRNLLGERLNEAMNRAKDTDTELALIYIDLDQFKNINDAFGHELGDEVIKLASQRIQSCARAGTTIARVGGDEFHVLVPNIADMREITDLANDLLTALSSPYMIEGREIFSSASIGVGMYPSQAETLSKLMRSVDIAANNAKRGGRANYKLFDPAMSKEVHRRVDVGHLLRRALENDELSLNFQAKVDLETRQITGAEALLRWHSEQLSFVSPAEFVPIAEETGLIVPIGEWVLATACREAAKWPTFNGQAIQVGVNLSALQFMHGNLVERVANSLSSATLAPTALDLELTESLLVERPEETIRTLNELKEMGITISMDDFGTGYSSLSYLTRFPLDSLKVDRAFVTDVPEKPDAVVVVRAIVGMAKQLDLRIVAEGIETAHQMEFLHGLGCHTGQGYFFSKPISNDAFIDLLNSKAAE